MLDKYSATLATSPALNMSIIKVMYVDYSESSEQGKTT